MNSVEYYNKHAQQFIDSTFYVNMESLHHVFLQYLPSSGLILDVGCGSGRDSLAFKNQGYCVVAMDYSGALIKLATELTGIPVRYQSFYDVKDIETFDGIWACASLLHCERSRLETVVSSFIRALKVHGVLYMSFKYGDQDRELDGRNFSDLNQQQAWALLNKFQNVELIQQWVTEDKRVDRSEKWLNILWRRND